MSAAINAMVTGTMSKDAEAKVSAGGKEYVLIVIRTTGEPAQFVRVSLFGDDCEGALGLRKGDAVSVVGSLQVGIWKNDSGTAGPSLNLMAHRCIGPSIKKPRKKAFRAATPTPQPSFRSAAEAQSIRSPAAPGELRDDIPWD